MSNVYALEPPTKGKVIAPLRVYEFLCIFVWLGQEFWELNTTIAFAQRSCSTHHLGISTSSYGPTNAPSRAATFANCAWKGTFLFVVAVVNLPSKVFNRIELSSRFIIICIAIIIVAAFCTFGFLHCVLFVFVFLSIFFFLYFCFVLLRFYFISLFPPFAHPQVVCTRLWC